MKETLNRSKIKNITGRVGIFGLIVIGIVGIKMTGLSDYLDQSHLEAVVESYGNLAPLLFVLLYAVAPSLFIPGLPITVAAGIIFGPLWGVIYSITGATCGAAIAFLFSRYISGNFIEKKISGAKWVKFHDSTEKNGWKIVAVTRLVPLFPFNILNYAFGLTKISFSDYIITTFICMLPGCIAIIVFSSSLTDLLKGRITFGFIIGTTLLTLVSLTPLLYRKICKRKGMNKII